MANEALDQVANKKGKKISRMPNKWNDEVQRFDECCSDGKFQCITGCGEDITSGLSYRHISDGNEGSSSGRRHAPVHCICEACLNRWTGANPTLSGLPPCPGCKRPLDRDKNIIQRVDCTKKPEVKPETDPMGPTDHDYENLDPDPDERPKKRTKTADFFDLTKDEDVIYVGFGHQQNYQQKIIKHLQRAMELTKRKGCTDKHDGHYKKMWK
jgi:hypothetical protein